jgi:hypothetical protein
MAVQFVTEITVVTAPLVKDHEPSRVEDIGSGDTGRATRMAASAARQPRAARTKPAAYAHRQRGESNRVDAAGHKAAGANKAATARRRGSSRQTDPPSRSNRRVSTVEAPCQ